MDEDMLKSLNKQYHVIVIDWDTDEVVCDETVKGYVLLASKITDIDNKGFSTDIMIEYENMTVGEVINAMSMLEEDLTEVVTEDSNECDNID